jgi:putative aldouronate transport system permease protein
LLNKIIDNRKIKYFWRQRYLQAFVFFGLAFIFVFHYLPMVGILIAFKEFRIVDGFLGIFTNPSVGLKNFKEFIGDYKTPTIIKNTLVMSFVKLIFVFPLPILLALVLNEVHSKPIKRVVQTASYLPYFISWVIVSGFCTIFLNMDGVFNSAGISLGLIDKPLNFLTSKQYFLPVVLFTSIWKDTGWWAIIFLASIAGIDPTLYEVANIDGAGRLKRIWHITLPGISGTITIVTILAVGNLLGGGLSGSNFEQSYLLGNPGNIDVSDIIQTYVMRIGIAENRYSYAAAVGLMQSTISVTLIYFSNLIAKKISSQSLF